MISSFSFSSGKKGEVVGCRYEIYGKVLIWRTMQLGYDEMLQIANVPQLNRRTLWTTISDPQDTSRVGSALWAPSSYIHIIPVRSYTIHTYRHTYSDTHNSELHQPGNNNKSECEAIYFCSFLYLLMDLRPARADTGILPILPWANNAPTVTN